MKTILDNKEFKEAFGKHCIEENLDEFYLEAINANKFRKPLVYVKGDYGDEVFNAVYRSLKDMNIIKDRHDDSTAKEFSPYDFITISWKDTDNFKGIVVEFKDISLLDINIEDNPKQSIEDYEKRIVDLKIELEQERVISDNCIETLKEYEKLVDEIYNICSDKPIIKEMIEKFNLDHAG